jgi:hypothetical protein
VATAAFSVVAVEILQRLRSIQAELRSPGPPD